MTIADVITAVSHVKPHQYSDEVVARWISELEGRVWEDVYAEYTDAPAKPALPYRSASDTLAKLLIPFPHDGLYIKWVCSQIDYFNADYDRYANSAQMFLADYEGFVDAHTRSSNRKPLYITGCRGDFA